jgi:hypothetical protein
MNWRAIVLTWVLGVAGIVGSVVYGVSALGEQPLRNPVAPYFRLVLGWGLAALVFLFCCLLTRWLLTRR